MNENQQMHTHKYMKVYYVLRIRVLPSSFGHSCGHLQEGALQRWPHEWPKLLGETFIHLRVFFGSILYFIKTNITLND